MSIWYHKTKECTSCVADCCYTPPSFGTYKCPCINCIVKMMCNTFCYDYLKFENTYSDHSGGGIKRGG